MKTKAIAWIVFVRKFAAKNKENFNYSRRKIKHGTQKNRTEGREREEKEMGREREKSEQNKRSMAAAHSSQLHSLF